MSKGSYVSLTAGLLARKGEAVPATTSFEGEHIVSAHSHRRPLSSTSLTPARSAWTDANFVLRHEESQNGNESTADAGPQAVHHGHDEPQPPESASREEHRPEECEPCVPLAALASGDDGIGRRSSVTFRLDATRYLCLKMAGAKLGRTNQDILTAALDMYLKSLADDALGDCTCLQQLIKGGSHVNHS